MELIENYSDGEWIKELGEYFHICLECCEEYTGRRNKDYCSATCKSKHNNDKRRERDPMAKIKMLSYQKSAEVLHYFYDPKKRITEVEITLLIKKGLKIDSPYNLLKLNNHEGECKKIGSYAYQQTADGQRLKILKLK